MLARAKRTQNLEGKIVQDHICYSRLNTTVKLTINMSLMTDHTKTSLHSLAIRQQWLILK